MSAARREFWSKHPGLVCSNPNADDFVFIRAALVRPRFSRLLEIAVEFGLDRVRAEWEILNSEPILTLTALASRSSAFCAISRKASRLLPLETEKVWNFLSVQPALAGFILIGGSALSLRIQHRISESPVKAQDSTRRRALGYKCLAHLIPT